MKKIVFIFIFFPVLISCNDKVSKNRTNERSSESRIETIKWINKTFEEMEINTRSLYIRSYINNIKNGFFEQDSTCINMISLLRTPKDTTLISAVIPFKDVVVYQEEREDNNFIAIGFKPKKGIFRGTAIKNRMIEVIEYNQETPMFLPFNDTPINRKKISELIKKFNYLIEKYGDHSMTKVDYQ